jgi:hypothetical protein
MSDIWMTRPEGRLCILGNVAVCEGLVLNADTTARSARQADGIYSLVGAHSGRQWLGTGSRYLADLAREMGSERFALFWTSDGEPTQAFRHAFGIEIGQWTYEWLIRTHGQAVPGAHVSASKFIVAALLVSGFVGLAAAGATRRQIR